MAHGKHGHGDDHYGEPGARHAAVAADPEHDIDARSATIWVVAGAVVLFISLWVMVPIFVRVQEAERMRKVDTAPNSELEDVRDAERSFLRGDNPQKKSIDQILQQMAGK
jgi:hypothetical protein